MSYDILYKVFSGNAAKELVFDNLVLELLCLFPVYRARAVYEHWTFFSARTQNGKLAGREEILSEFGKVCWIRIVDYTFKGIHFYLRKRIQISVRNQWTVS